MPVHLLPAQKQTDQSVKGLAGMEQESYKLSTPLFSAISSNFAPPKFFVDM